MRGFTLYLLFLRAKRLDMKPNLIRLYILLSLLLISLGTQAQIKGVVTDSITHEPLLYVTVQYPGKGVGAITNNDGEFTVEAHRGWTVLRFSSIGYKTKDVTLEPGQRTLNIALAPEATELAEVVVTRRARYSRRNNPAVEFMRKVIAHKKGNKLEDNDYYSYQKYEKMKMSINDVTNEKLEKGIYKRFAFFKDQVEVSHKTGKQILPVSVKETGSRTIYRKSPKSKKTIIEGMNSSGVDEFFSTGDMMGTILTDVFSDINIYDDDIRLLQRQFVSPIGRGAITFYQYYLEDTIQVDGTECIHLSFVPQNPQDFGFTGHLYVARDSTYAVKRATMNLPKKTGVNFVEHLDIVQNYEQLPDSTWVLTDDDMTVELALMSGVGEFEVERTTKYTKYNFEAIEPRLFRLGGGEVIKEANMMNKSDEYWAEVRQVPLTKTESSMDLFMNRLEQLPGFKYVIFGAKALIENFVETGGRKHPSKFDLGPINTTITSNYVNGMRLRLSGLTTGNFHPHWNFSGYGAYGFKDKKWFYQGQAAYSFNKREYVLWEFPKHYIAFKYQYDVMSPMDKFLDTDKDNVFVGMKWTKVDQMSYIREASLNYELETNSGFSVKAMARHRNDEPTGALAYYLNDGPVPGEWSEQNTRVKDMTTAEVGVTLRYAPGETYVNTKQRRIPVSLDAPVFSVSHTAGFKGILGGDYNFNLTEASIRKRWWFGSWGKLDVTLRGGAQWNKVPFPLLNLPQANLSYINQYNTQTYSLINNMEFLNDRYASLHMVYDLNGKLFNRIPLLKKLKWREMFKVNVLYGKLTDKNNPYMGNKDLYLFPMRDGQVTSYIMGETPYVEASVGIYNIFKLLHVEYVRRLTYTDIPGVKKDGIRFMVMMVF